MDQEKKSERKHRMQIAVWGLQIIYFGLSVARELKQLEVWQSGFWH